MEKLVGKLVKVTPTGMGAWIWTSSFITYSHILCPQTSFSRCSKMRGSANYNNILHPKKKDNVCIEKYNQRKNCKQNFIVIVIKNDKAMRRT